MDEWVSELEIEKVSHYHKDDIGVVLEFIPSGRLGGVYSALNTNE